MCLKVLVVDDSKLNVMIVKDILETEEYSVFSSYDGNSVIEMCYEISPDVILLDIIMPGMDGFQVCKLLKNNTRTKDIPVIMITSRTNSSDVKRALDLGAFDYIKKPIDEVELIARIQSAIRFNAYQEKLKEMAMRDGLTGLYNHSLIIELFQKELDKKECISNSISFVMLDIDYFKKVNDTYGHLCGDMVLKEVSNILTSSVSNSDILGRYGGEEFSIVSSGISKEELNELCEHIRKNIEENEFRIGNETFKITISIGAFFKENRNNISNTEMIKKADEALYKAKENGRNKVEMVYD